MSKLITINSNQINEVELITLEKGSEEFKWVENEFKRTGVRNQIESIQVVNNKSLWLKYNSNRQKFIGNGKHETFGYHGTRVNDTKLIYIQGLKKEFTVKGLYFATQSLTSHGYTHNNGTYFQMFMCRLLVPSIQVTAGGVYVIQNNDDHYPQYLISYRYN